MTFGLTNSLESLIDRINTVFQNNIYLFVIAIIDNIFVYSKSEDEHIGHFKAVLEVLKE